MKLKSGMADSSDRPRIVIVGAGFAGFHCARALDRRLGSAAELILVNPVDHMVYSALLPEVVGGVVDPRCVATPLAASLPSTRVLIGAVTAVDIAERTCTVRAVGGRRQVLAWDRLVLNPGSVTGTFGVAGVVEHARGFKTLAEALYLREQILRQLQLAGATDDAEVRRGHATFVVVGGGFTGLELAAQGAALAQAALRQERALDAGSVRWTVLEAGTSVLGQFPSRLARHALDRIRKQRVDVRLGTAVAEVAAGHVRLATGEIVSARTVVWTAGVTPRRSSSNSTCPWSADVWSSMSSSGHRITRTCSLSETPQPSPTLPSTVSSPRRPPSTHSAKGSPRPATSSHRSDMPRRGRTSTAT